MFYSFHSDTSAT